MTKKTFLLDMDGVLVDLVPAVFDFWEVPHEKDEYPEGVFACQDAAKVLKPGFDVPSEQFWGCLSIDFWKELPKTEHCDEIMTKAVELAGLYNVFFCTFPCTPQSAAGKMLWVEKNFPGMTSRIIMCREKWALAKPGYILVDDRCQSCRDFRHHGGDAIVVPRAWNELKSFRNHWGPATLRQMQKVYHHGEG